MPGSPPARQATTVCLVGHGELSLSTADKKRSSASRVLPHASNSSSAGACSRVMVRRRAGRQGHPSEPLTWVWGRGGQPGPRNFPQNPSRVSAAGWDALLPPSPSWGYFCSFQTDLPLSVLPLIPPWWTVLLNRTDSSQHFFCCVLDFASRNVPLNSPAVKTSLRQITDCINML